MERNATHWVGVSELICIRRYVSFWGMVTLSGMKGWCRFSEVYPQARKDKRSSRFSI
ncbi:hypothetical protein M758_12G058200 [Ceratodon purpureus]|uniref:Uncharacterized protein n=1 Tax=Ceratodon purpureus TaxID=3225 RepID=A0A8T0G534_CERPU|nr:hypothetical protein KC19_12G055400 [Ceratodon purpureus]KAG0598255.1 hypothetical protein M758_12G058200 [Ceratodon purpureus]